MASQHADAGYKKIQLITNAFEITQLPTKKYAQYDETDVVSSLSAQLVTFNPPCPIRNKRVQLIHHLQMNVAPEVFNPRILYDGQAIVYASRQLKLANNGSGTFNVRLGTPGAADPAAKDADYPSPFRHVYDLIREKKSTARALVATNLIQLIIRQGPNMHNTNNGRAYFTGEDKNVLTGSGLELWRGTFQSVRPTMGKMILNVDTCTAAVYQSGPLINICLQKIRARDTRDLDLRERDMNFKNLEKFLKGVRMKVKAGKSRIQTIRGLVPAAGEFTFIKDDTVEMTVASYFQQAYNIRIQYPRIIGVRLTSNKNPRQDIIPLELCEIEHGQLFKRKIPEELTSDMVRFSTMKPHVRLEKIQTAAQLSVRSDFVAESGMKLDLNPMGVDAKLLFVPSLFFHPERPALVVRDGAWNALRQRFTQPAALAHWMVVSFVDAFDIRKITDMMTARGSSLLNSCGNLGMNINPSPFIQARANGHNAERILTDSVRGYSEQLGVPESDVDRFLRKLMVIVLLPNNGAGIRSAVKHWGDVTLGVATQCLREAKLHKANDQYWNNIALKLNARLSGTNFFSVSPVLTQLKNEPFMIIGADVGHPGPGVQKPSVTGIVYSHDQFATQYVALTGIQPPRVEQIMDLRRYIIEAVGSFAQKNQGPPKRLIFFRDGISEGEFDKVAPLEIAEIKAAFSDLWVKMGVSPQQSPFPRVTYIVVGKRHHAVFFPGRQGQGDRTGNAYAGSLIDSGVTHPAVHDFYLQSHAAIQGTCRSSHYSILLDENWNNEMQKVQELSYTLCHVYAKATRSVSIPAPVYYADLVCSRGMFHVDPNNRDLGFDDNVSTVSGSSNSPLDMSRWQQAFRNVHPRLARSMYFL
ncbi:hypothetical protein CVT25_008331 [Psilocybe cyanescens]|uniref:Piwi domain-containing protein n=1 Tax=Psilocybe cyanescens TaxID=93625 RepID=A0A409WV18_PSICY|nr:hypothetical protein CVT25_008331 [Psilocybe cyanescens]